ncbi:MAG: phosphonoacetaldehyde hydrolase [Candidatus Korobacteraceae bacterium]|jgi:phosphonoacetaldehyde hydrolase
MHSQNLQSGVRAVIFDVSGTVLDYGSRGPVIAFVELFARHGVTVSEAEARRPMGAHKKDHLWAMLTDPAICARWTKANGQQPTRELLDELYNQFPAMMKQAVENPPHCDLIPGVVEVTQELRRRGIPFANTTGFDAGMMDTLKKSAVAAGYCPDLWVTPDLVSQGRPYPWMAFYAARHLGVYPMSSFVKVGDTIVDVEEGHNAGMWTISILRSGNEVGLSEQQLDALPAAERDHLLAAARQRLEAAGPHYIINTVFDLMPVIDIISSRISRGERP